MYATAETFGNRVIALPRVGSCYHPSDATRDARIPVLPAYLHEPGPYPNRRAARPDPLLKLWCFWCGRWHTHGGDRGWPLEIGFSFGHRRPHCCVGGSPFQETGYFLAYGGPWTDRVRRGHPRPRRSSRPSPLLAAIVERYRCPMAPLAMGVAGNAPWVCRHCGAGRDPQTACAAPVELPSPPAVGATWTLRAAGWGRRFTLPQIEAPISQAQKKG